MKYHFNNAMGDECIFVHFGKGTLYTQFGTIPFRERDYLIIPKGTIYRLVFDDTPEGEERPRIMVIETANGSHIRPPPRYIRSRPASSSNACRIANVTCAVLNLLDF